MKALALRLIKLYQGTISQVRAPSCRFQPTCSQYTYEAIAKFGVCKGIALGAWRICRCNPLNHGGYDPVP